MLLLLLLLLLLRGLWWGCTVLLVLIIIAALQANCQVATHLMCVSPGSMRWACCAKVVKVSAAVAARGSATSSWFSCSWNCSRQAGV
jgi:hypothetical protein